jgi:hypothetical protein
MKKAVLSLLLGVAALGLMSSGPASALTASGDFDVTVKLFPKCEFTTAPSALTLNYVSFQTTASDNTQNFVLKCTNTLPYNFSLTEGTSTAGGTLAGLSYTLSTVTTAGAAAPGSTGTGAAQTFAIKGSIAGNQGGTCAQDNSTTALPQSASVTGTTAGVGTACSATSATGAHTLTITY